MSDVTRLHSGLGIGLVVLVDQFDLTAENAARRVDFRGCEIEAELGLAAEQFEASGKRLHDADLDGISSQQCRHRESGGGGDPDARLDESAA